MALPVNPTKVDPKKAKPQVKGNKGQQSPSEKSIPAKNPIAKSKGSKGDKREYGRNKESARLARIKKSQEEKYKTDEKEANIEEHKAENAKMKNKEVVNDNSDSETEQPEMNKYPSESEHSYHVHEIAMPHSDDEEDYDPNNTNSTAVN